MTAQETGLDAFPTVGGQITMYEPDGPVDAYLTGRPVNVGDWE